MTNQEIICTFMEPRPSAGFATDTASIGGWWRRYAGVGRSRPDWQSKPFNGPWLPHVLTLVELWEVEERLTDEQWEAYSLVLVPSGDRFVRDRIHATPEQKINALAAILRPIVEKQETTATQK